MLDAAHFQLEGVARHLQSLAESRATSAAAPGLGGAVAELLCTV